MQGEATQPWEVPAQTIAQYKNEFLRFFDGSYQGDKESSYREIVDSAVTNDRKRILINLEHLRRYDAENRTSITRELIAHPKNFQQAIIEALHDYRLEVNQKNVDDLQFGLTGPIGDHLVSPRNLNSRFLNQIVCLDGIVTKTSLVNPKLVTLSQYCPESNQWTTTHFHSETDLTARPTRFAVPTKDSKDRPLEVEYGFSEFVDHQVLTIQERPEAAPAGQMPRSCDVIADADLADACKPGDRVKIYGVYRILPSRVQGAVSGIYHPVLIANSIEVASQTLQLSLSDTDIGNIRFIAGYKDPKTNVCDAEENNNIIDLLSRSLAPSIYGHKRIKESLVLLLAGGSETNLADGTHIRGDINILMVGDPSTAKSQLLRHLMTIAPLAVHSTGRGSSGVGLTASVTSDSETGERKLEAGAMVIADRGVVCIDEFDKMDEADRVAIHEALEQQTVTISKAGIHATLNARCSVLAAANPVWGTYNPNRSPMDNVGLPDSLISRFDLLFVVLDEHNPQTDAAIADHVLDNHKWKVAGPAQSFTDDGIYLKSDAIPHTEEGDQVNYVTIEFLKKYVTYCKALRPVLTKEAEEKLVNAWAEMRAISNRKTQPITPRAFETLIRLATASAKIRLSEEVTARDADIAISLLTFSIYGEDEIPTKTKSKKTRSQKKKENDYSSDSLDEESDDLPSDSDSDDEINVPRKKKQQKELEATIEEPILVSTEEALDDIEEKRAAFIFVFHKYLDTSVISVTCEEFIQEIEKEKHIQITIEELRRFLEEIGDQVTYDDERIAF
jgi:DNA replication licensing factor MCM3